MLYILFVVYRAQRVRQTKWGEQFYGRKPIEIQAKKLENDSMSLLHSVRWYAQYLSSVSCAIYDAQYAWLCVFGIAPVSLTLSVYVYILKCANHPNNSS